MDFRMALQPRAPACGAARILRCHRRKAVAAEAGHFLMGIHGGSLALNAARALIPRDQFQHVGVHFFPGIGAQGDEIEGGNEAGVAFVVEEVDEVHVGGVVKG